MRIDATERNHWYPRPVSSRGSFLEDRYDLLLGLIPTAFAVAGLVGRVFGLPTEAALVGGVVIASLALLDGLVVRPPTKPPRDV